jgi:hypothetical protein
MGVAVKLTPEQRERLEYLRAKYPAHVVWLAVTSNGAWRAAASRTDKQLHARVLAGDHAFMFRSDHETP